MDDPNNLGTVPPGGSAAPGGGGENGAVVESLEAVLSRELGREFPTTEAALKAVKDTFSYVGEYGQVKPVIDTMRERAKAEGKPLATLMAELAKPAVTPQVDESRFVPRDQYETDNFFSKNPAFAENRYLIEALATKEGKPVHEVVNTDAFKAIFGKIQLADETTKSRSVVMTNPRLGQASDTISKANEAVKAGNVEQGKALAADAVVEAFGLRK